MTKKKKVKIRSGPNATKITVDFCSEHNEGFTFDEEEMLTFILFYFVSH